MNSFEKVYKVVSKIPKGKVLTYKKVCEIAEVANARVVGFALNKNKDPDKIPCHRVISIKGELTGYAFGGIKQKRKILEKEGIDFLENGKVDLKKYSFNPLSLLPLYLCAILSSTHPRFF